VTTKNILLIMATIILLLSCAPQPPYWKPSGTPQGEPPQITAYYGAHIIRPGDTWRVYLRANDPDGDMAYIATTIRQDGVGFYPAVRTRLEPNNRGELAGYLFLPTPPDPDLVWDQFQITLLVRDREGNGSKPVTLPLTFNYRNYTNPEKVSAEWNDVADTRLGTILVDIISSERYNTQGDHGDRVLFW